MRNAYLTEQAQSDLKRIPKSDQRKVQKKFALFIYGEVEGKKLTGKLQGFFSVKVWPYRIIYFINEKKEIWIVHIKHRKEVYRR